MFHHFFLYLRIGIKYFSIKIYNDILCIKNNMEEVI